MTPALSDFQPTKGPHREDRADACEYIQNANRDKLPKENGSDRSLSHLYIRWLGGKVVASERWVICSALW